MTNLLMIGLLLLAMFGGAVMVMDAAIGSTLHSSRIRVAFSCLVALIGGFIFSGSGGLVAMLVMR